MHHPSNNKTRWLAILLLFTSFIGYLEWGDNHTFLFQQEIEMLQKLIRNPGDLIHPLVILPILGQCALIIPLFQKTPSRWLIILGIAGIGLLFIFILIAGIAGKRFKMILSVLPFLITAAVLLVHLIRKKSKST